MSKVILTPTRNGAENIRLSKLATRQSNLTEDRSAWQTLSVTPCSKLLPIYKDKFLRSGRVTKVIDHDYDDAMGVGWTITQRIVTRYADDFNVLLEEDVTTLMIKEMATEYLAWPERAQLLVCRDPSRQTMDEEVQKATLEKYLPTATVNKPTNGVLTLVNGDIIKKPKKDNVEARSIDFVVNNNGNEFNVFAKYSAVAGSGQSHQLDESKRFIKEAIKYIDKHNDKKYFIALTDGAEGERHLSELNELANGYPAIFAGNCESVIDFISAK
jgi:hypothetical protein